MPKAVITKSLLTAIADAIRAKTGGTAALTPAQMAEEIAYLPTDDGLLDAWLTGTNKEYVTNALALRDYACYMAGSISAPVQLTPLKATSVGQYAFSYSYLKSLILPAVDLVNAHAFEHARFIGNNNDAKLSLPALTTINAANAFYYLERPTGSGRVLIDLPVLNSINTGAINAFAYTSVLRTISQSDNTPPAAGWFKLYVPQLTTISAKRAFNGCTFLTDVDLPYVQHIGPEMFETCKALAKIVLTCIKTISTMAFTGCTKLTAVVLDIGENADLPVLENTDAFTNTPIAKGTGYIYVTDSRVEELKAATNWVTYAGQIKPLSEYVEEE